MAIPTKTLFYSDFDFRFTGHPQTGRLIVRKNTDAVTQALKLLLMTGQHERPFRPNLGANIRQYLFENFGPFVSAEIKEAITQAIQNSEPRAVLLDVKAEPNPGGNELAVTIVYRPVNATQPVEVNLTLERVR